MSSEVAIAAEGIGKAYAIFNRPPDRLKQMIVPRLQRMAGFAPYQYHQQFWALQDVSFDVKKGEVVGIVGRNGSGKSTLLQLVCGIIQPTTGRIDTYGRVAALLELGAGFNPEFTGRDNAFFNGQLLGLTVAQITSKIEEIEAFADVGDFFRRPVKTYSSGMYVRLAFAVQACLDPEILVVDEALAVGDAAFQAKCINRIHRLRQSGTSILFVSHDISSVRTLCDRAIWIDSGRLRMAGSVMPVTSAYIESVFANSITETSRVQTGDQASVPTQIGRPDKPINHWGSHVGMLLNVSLLDSGGREAISFSDREPITVRIRIGIPPGIDRETLSVAFSLKSLAGIDLIVGTTWHEGRLSFRDIGEVADINFSFDNILNRGIYMVAVGVEDRTAPSAKYYEYVEGCIFFQIDRKEEFYGIVAPPIEKRVADVTSWDAS